MIELVSKRDAWKNWSKSMNYTDKFLNIDVISTLSLASLRASISEGWSCASLVRAMDTSEKCRLRSARVPSSRACQSVRTLFGLST